MLINLTYKVFIANNVLPINDCHFLIIVDFLHPIVNEIILKY